MSEPTLVFEGAIATKAAMLAGNRVVYEIIMDKKRRDKDSGFIKQQAEKRNIPVTMLSREQIDALYEGKTHGGIVSKVSERHYQTLSDVVKIAQPFLAILEGIEDPYNFAYALRSLYASGCHGVLVGERNWTTAADVIAKASAGASEYINIIVCADMEQTMNQLKKHNIKLICCMREDAIPYYEETLTQGICLAIGGEMRGLSKTILDHSDQNVYIPYGSTFRNALTASSATAIVAFEVTKQRTIASK